MSMSKPTVRIINDGKELLMSSATAGALLSLYADGKLKNQVTHGEFVTEDVLASTRSARHLRTGRGQGRRRGPLLHPHYRANLDGRGMKLLESGRRIAPPRSCPIPALLRRQRLARQQRASRRLFSTRRAPDPRSRSHRSQAPRSLRLQNSRALRSEGRCGVTDLLRVMYKPSISIPPGNTDRRFVYPATQTESVTKNLLSQKPECRAGKPRFIVIEVGNRGGNPHRSAVVSHLRLRNLRDYGLADKKARSNSSPPGTVHRIDRVGIYGTPCGGFMSPRRCSFIRISSRLRYRIGQP